MTLTYLCGLMQTSTIRNALIVMPPSVQTSWVSDFYDFIEIIGESSGIALQPVLTGYKEAKVQLRDAIQWYVYIVHSSCCHVHACIY